MFNKFFKNNTDSIYHINIRKLCRSKKLMFNKDNNGNVKVYKESSTINIYCNDLQFMYILLGDLKVKNKGICVHNTKTITDNSISVHVLPLLNPTLYHKRLPWPILEDLKRYYILVENTHSFVFYITKEDFLRTSIIVNRLYNAYIY
jgi:hypothetical protein